MLENIKITNHELVIGLVGAVGSSLSPLTDIVQNLLEQQFNYQVEIIRVSKDILAEFYPYTQNGSAFDRNPTLWTKAMNCVVTIRMTF